jgi:hypothetical protein
MANPSPFLQYQDKNGDFLLDDCEIKLPGPIEKVCLDCVPNPKALVQNWKTSLNTPFLNEKLCLYQVGVKTSHTDTGGNDGIIERFETYKEEAIELFLDEYEKEVGVENIEALRAAIIYDPEKDFQLEARGNSVLSLLYSVPFDVIENLEDASDDNDDDKREPIEVTYLASELPVLFTRVRKGLGLYSRYTTAENVLNGSSLVFDKSRSVFNINDYGDRGFGRSSQMAKVFVELDRFLNRRGFNIVGAGSFGFGKDRVVKLKIGFDKKFKVKKLAVFSLGCREKPKVFKGRKISALNRIDVFKDRTAMAYFAQLADMERDLTARSPKKFTEFIMDYTFPTVVFLNAEEILEGETNCVADKIRDTVQGLGQDLLDDVLGIGDILAYQFHKHICRTEEEENSLREQFGEVYRPIEELSVFGSKKNKKESVFSKGSLGAIGGMAKQQAYEKLQANPNVFVQLCADVLIAGTPVGGALSARGVWDNSFNKLKLCGLLDFLLDALGCLWGGLELEEALRIALTSALQAMGIKNFGVLFVGLPPEEQAELDVLVKRKLAEAKQSADTRQTAAQDQERDSVDADAKVFGEISFVKPFEDPALMEQEDAARTAGPYEGTTVSSGVYEAQSSNFGRRPRIGTTYNNPEEISGRQTAAADAIKSLDKSAEQTFSPDVIMEAYILALVEYYSGRLLDLVDKLNEFPGAEIISKILAVVDCPRPPLFTPSVMDFLKDVELPFCRNIGDIALPKLTIPPINLKDILKRIALAIVEAIVQYVLDILLKLMIKICEILGEAICKALETTGNIIGGLPGLITGNTTIRDIVRDSICGPGASEDDVNDSIAAMFETLGGAGANLANKDKVLEFNEAIASSSTRQEIIDASLGNPSQEFLSIVDTIIDVQFPEFRDAMPNTQAIGSFFGNFGNLLPAEVKAQLDDIANQNYENLDLPANPTLCATPDQIAEFCAVRASILEGRASDEQIATLCTRPTQDFADLNNVLQDGIPGTIMNNMPPILSDPGCSNGLFPYEPEELQSAASAGLSGDLENLKIAYSFDMLGNGVGKENWGYMNMVLSDTMGRPFTNHMRNVNRFALFGSKKYIDFYVDQEANDEDDGADEVGIIGYGPERKQRGAFPVYVGEWGATYWSGSSDKIKVNTPNNSLTDARTFTIETNDDITALYNYGYNMKYKPTEDGYKITRRARKSQADIVLKFRDNRDGNGEQLFDNESMSVGYNFKFFFSAIRAGANTRDNNVRVLVNRITNNYNYKFDQQDAASAEYSTEIPDPEADDEKEKSNKVNSSRIYEFVGSDGSVDDLLDEIGSQFISEYPKFETSLEEVGNESPLIVLMAEMLGISTSQAKSYWTSTTEKIIESFGNKIFNLDTNKSFMYGAKPNTLTSEDAEYGVVRNGNFVPYADVEVDGETLTNDDSTLGISRDQHINGDKARVYYLDPNKFGGSYVNPKVYIKPVDTEGLLGLVNVMFPELSPCKPRNTDLVDFGDIASTISNSYTNYPDDPRLAGDPDCVVEKPFDRILSRVAKSGIEGTIAAACRIYASIHFLKTINTFSVLKPDFKNNMSTMYASFILEHMEKEMRDSQGAFGELFNPFKDDEFYYAFLEQAVQTYFQMVQSGKITDVPTDIESALERIGEAQNKYKYPDRDKMQKAKVNGNAPVFQTLPQFREDRNLAAVKSVEEDCKLILKEFMVQEVNFLSDVFYKNMISEGFIDKDTYIYNVMYYILSAESGLTAGSELDMAGEIREEVVDIPTGENQYTDGNMLALEDGTPYVGYYHSHIDEVGDTIFMVGEEHSIEDHAVLRPFANKVQVNIGNVIGTNSAGNKPFYIRKYIKVDEEKTYDSAISGVVETLKGKGDTLVSEAYPGSLEHVYDAGTPEAIQNRVARVREKAQSEGREPTPDELRAAREGDGRPVVGLKGELGVRYGLEFRTSTGHLIASSEIDVLDLPLSMLQPLEGGSKELLCLINKLIDDPKFKLFMDYALPVRKMVSALAIYNNLTYLESIGQISSGGKKVNKSNINEKPGIKVDSDGNFIRQVPGWLPKKERSGGLFVLTWDDWNRQTLAKSTAVLKKMFKSYYYSRDFGKQDKPTPTAGQVAIQNLKEKFKFAPGDRSVPRWNRRASNPFDARGRMCESSDDN